MSAAWFQRAFHGCLRAWGAGSIWFRGLMFKDSVWPVFMAVAIQGQGPGSGLRGAAQSFEKVCGG